MAVDPRALGLAGGVVWGVSVFLAGVGAIVVASWRPAVQWLGQFYLGYGPSIGGSVVGAVWGFVDVFVGLYAFAWLYNYFREHPAV